jgi:hypothetical protein
VCVEEPLAVWLCSQERDENALSASSMSIIGFDFFQLSEYTPFTLSLSILVRLRGMRVAGHENDSGGS